MFQIIDHFPEVLKRIQLLGRGFFQPIVEVMLIRFIEADDPDRSSHQAQNIKSTGFYQRGLIPHLTCLSQVDSLWGSWL